MRKKIRDTVLVLMAIAVLASIFTLSSRDAESMGRVVVPVAAPAHAPKIETKPDYFSEALAVVLKHEGVFSDDPADKGGATRWGISLRFLQAESIDIDGDGDSDMQDILALTKNDANKIYLQKFWNRNGYDRILDKNIAIKMMDMAVNTGSNRAHKILKKAINRVIYEPIAVDKTLDDETIQIVNLVEPSLLLKALRKEQAQFYLDIIKITPSYKKFEKGWLARSAW